MSYRPRGSQVYQPKPRYSGVGLSRIGSQISPNPRYAEQWSVPSQSSPGKEYIVSLTKDGEWQCSCPQWIYRHKECKHIAQVRGSAFGAVIKSAKALKPKRVQTKLRAR